ncbi:SWI/SNF-related matrix-associated actin-dependent regulator of chromatin subfamily E member 1-related-like [Pollicipes pollicipes]|uniref:SWI/SNF-related matrix-associated actin-dependent regulator of chromatin subfamily E member 1-related-like n=1 Tax=Pollicipes pollicipes TaxID=41117 RepID=UPI001885A0E7|nr:SWI/SNF-related matrix-associated actin-dependent regulator of chromatin subfamily E member 1-related-like [Pollicipes pollicipes]
MKGSDGADFDISSFFNQLTAATPAPDPGSVPGSGPGPPGSSQLMDRTCVAAELNEGLSAVDQHTRGSRRPGVGRPKRTPPEYGDPPPAPLSAYNLFAKEQYPRLKARWRGLNVRRAGPKLSSLWAGLSPAERGVYQERAYQQKEQYRQQLTDYRRRAQAEEDGDSTDQPEVHSDDDRNDLYCRLCDAYFSSSHNKEQHLHSRQHVRVTSADSEDERPDSPLEPPADVSGALENVLHQTVRREQEIRCLTEARAQLGEQQRQLRQLADELEVRHDRAAMDLESETSHSRQLTDQLENLLLVPTLFGVMSQWSCDAQPGGVS